MVSKIKQSNRPDIAEEPFDMALSEMETNEPLARQYLKFLTAQGLILKKPVDELTHNECVSTIYDIFDELKKKRNGVSFH